MIYSRGHHRSVWTACSLGKDIDIIQFINNLLIEQQILFLVQIQIKFYRIMRLNLTSVVNVLTTVPDFQFWHQGEIRKTDEEICANDAGSLSVR